jgi:hypothetical protein
MRVVSVILLAAAMLYGVDSASSCIGTDCARGIGGSGGGGGGGGADDQTASEVSNTPAGTIAATTVQAAVNELDTEKAAKTEVAAYTSGTDDPNDAPVNCAAAGDFHRQDMTAPEQDRLWICNNATTDEWVRESGNVSWSLGDLKACLEVGDNETLETWPLARECVLGPGYYDVGTGFYALLPYLGARPQHATLRCSGSLLAASGALVATGPDAPNQKKAVVHISTKNTSHDTQLTIDGCRIDGSTDTDETLLLISHGDGAPPTQSGRIQLSNLDIGETFTAFDGTERGIWEYHYSGTYGAQLYADNVIVHAGGVVWQWDEIPGNSTALFSNVKIGGRTASDSSTDTRAANPCLVVEPTAAAPSQVSLGEALTFSGASFADCGGLTVTAASIQGTIALHDIGTSAEDAALIDLKSNMVQLDVTVGAESIVTHASHGPLFYWSAGQPSFDVRVAEQGCTYTNTVGGTPELFEVANGLAVWGDIKASLVSSGTGDRSGCAATPFGDEFMTEDYSIGDKEVTSYGWRTTIHDAMYLSIPMGARPFSHRVNTGSTGAYVYAISGMPTSGATTCLGFTGAGSCYPVATPGTTIPSTLIFVDPERPLAITGFDCTVMDMLVANADDAGDSVDAILQKSTFVADGSDSWSDVTATVGAPGRVRFTEPETTGDSFYYTRSSPSVSLFGGVIPTYAAGAIDTLRVGLETSVDTGDPVTSGAGTSRVSCTIKGWN